MNKEIWKEGWQTFSKSMALNILFDSLQKGFSFCMWSSQKIVIHNSKFHIMPETIHY